MVDATISRARLRELACPGRSRALTSRDRGSRSVNHQFAAAQARRSAASFGTWGMKTAATTIGSQSVKKR
jgi:hypothetical protein